MSIFPWVVFPYVAPWWAGLPDLVVYLLGILPVAVIWAVLVLCYAFLHLRLAAYWMIGILLTVLCYCVSPWMLPWDNLSIIIAVLGAVLPVLFIMDSKRSK